MDTIATTAPIPTAKVGLADRIKRGWMEYMTNRTIRVFYQMNDRELANIGVKRADIPAFVRGNLLP